MSKIIHDQACFYSYLQRFFRRNLSFLLIFLLGCLIFCFAPQYLATSRNEPTEIRGVWLTNIDSEVLFNKNTLSDAINTLHKLNFNTLYPTVWNWGYTLYPSQVAKRVTGQEIDPIEGLQNRDILQEIVEQGHQKKITVIPWFEFGFMAPADSQLAKRHPNWLTQRFNGDKIWLEGNVHQRVWLNPLRSDVQDFMTNLVLEVVKNYDIDGIQLDDHFGYPFDFGYDEFTVSFYQKEHNGKSPPKPPSNLQSVNNCVSNSQEWQEWTRWRSQKITDYMKQLFQAIKVVKPNVIISLSPNPQTFSKNCYLLDWYQWERMGLVEELVLQVYRESLESFQRELSQSEVKTAKQHIPFAIGVSSGLKGRPVPLQRLKKQVEIMRQQKFAGVSFFFYESLWNFGQESVMERQSALKTLFPTPVKRLP